MFPVHVVQSQGNDFTPSQPVDRQEQQNGAVPDIMGTVRIGAANESLHVFPLRPGWKRLVAEGLSLKEIGDHLGHRSAYATRTYAKVDLAALRQVADFALGDLL